MSIFRVAFPFRFTFPCDMFPNIDRIGNITCPVFIVHGTKDEVVPFWNGEQLFLAAPVHLRARPFWIDGGGHNNLEIFFKCVLSNAAFLCFFPKQFELFLACLLIAGTDLYFWSSFVNSLRNGCRCTFSKVQHYRKYQSLRNHRNRGPEV